MKILQLCKKFPYPVKDGESLAIVNLGKSLAENGCQVDLLAMNTVRHRVVVNKKAEALSHYGSIDAVEVDNRLKVKDAFLNLFSLDSYHISRFVSNNFSNKLITLLRQTGYDIIQLETLFLAPYIKVIRQNSNARIVMRAHNIESEIWERIVRNTQNPLKRVYLAYLTQKLKRYELSQFEHYDLLLAISSRDQQKHRKLGYSGDGASVPIGINAAAYKPDYHSENKMPTLSFIGSLDWMPNSEGIDWFLCEIWPRLNHKFPNLRFYIAGRNTPGWLAEGKWNNVEVLGEVDRATDFINAHQIMVVPLLSGSGMRVKILEAMALGRAVITSSIGLEGIKAQSYEEVIIAENEKEYAEALHFLIKDNNAVKMGKKARALIKEQFDSLAIGAFLKNKYHSMIN